MIAVLLIFPSVHWVLRAEKILIAENIVHQIRALPRELSSDCGMGIEITADLLEKVRVILENARITDYTYVTRALG